MISIKYHNGDRRWVLIQIHDSGGPYWRRLKHSLLDRDLENTYSMDQKSIVVPRLSFVSMYQEIFQAIRDMGLGNDVDLQTQVEEDLMRFIDLKMRRTELSEVLPEIPHEDILAKLVLSGWDMDSITPTEFQLKNLSRMCAYPDGAASFSVPGAGKTIEGCAFFAFHKNPDSRMIVTLPRVGYIAWEEELEKCLGLKPGTDVIRIDGRVEENQQTVEQNPEATVFLITYGRFMRNENLIFDILDRHECFLVLDESHRIKNESQRSMAVRSLSHLAKHRLILSGTPTPNETGDIERQYEFLYPGFNLPLDRIVDEMKKIQVRTKNLT